MIRSVLTALVVLAFSSPAFAGNPNDDKKAKEAEKKALKEQISQLKKEEAAQLKQIDQQFKTQVAGLGKAEGKERGERGRLEAEEKAAMKRIDERFHYIIEHLDRKHVRQELEALRRTVHEVHEVLTVGDFDYGGNRIAARRSLSAAERRLGEALEHDNFDNRAHAAKDLRVAAVDLEKALNYSISKYGLGTGVAKGEPESRAAANVQMANSFVVIEKGHHWLAAIDHEIKDVEFEKRELLKKRDVVKRQTHEEFQAKIKLLGSEIHDQKHDVKELEKQRDAAKKAAKAQYEAQIKQLEQQIKQIK
jgi:hypothetical protein